MDQRKLAEYLVILNYHGEGLLTSLNYVKNVMDPDTFTHLDSVLDDRSPKCSTPRTEAISQLLRDENYQTIYKALLKKFPEPADLNKSAGYAAFTANAVVFMDAFRYPYDIFIKTVEFTELTQIVLNGFDKLNGITVGQAYRFETNISM